MIPEAPEPFASRFELSKRIAKSAGKITLGYFQQDALAVEHKEDLSLIHI